MVGSFFSQILEKVTGYFVRSERHVFKVTTSRNTTLHQCGVCETPYTFGGPDPYLLPCLHSVCQTCHDADNTDTIWCGICQEDFKRNDVGETKDVVTTKQVLLSTTQNDAGAVLCTNNNDGIQAMSWNTLKEGIEHVSERLSLVKDLEGKVDGLELDIERNTQDLKEEIKHTFGQLRSVLDQRENEVLLELEKCKEAEKASNASLRKLLQHEDSTCESLLHFIQSCLELCCPTEVLSLKKKIEAKIIANSATKLPQHIRQKSSITFSQMGLRPLTESMATFGETCTAYYTSGVEFLYVEEATEEQKARARKYLLPESFYLYENKPPCPGCIGCEDYDPSKVSVPSKVKAKSKSEETSPAPTIASVQVSSSAGNTSGVEFLYVEEATEEQKARARKYLLPESFYLYENKPPCPGCIGCEDYDPSKVSVPSKVKAKSKSEETSPAPTIASVQVSSSARNTSGVEFLYVEEATEEQKARARKYLLPESFYLYENKPPCPGCIGCEDYDPSKVSVPSKVKAKSKSEETSPAPTIASVQVSSSAGSVAGSTGASEGFCMFGQASGMSFSTLAAQGDAVGYAFKKDENRPFQWSGAGQQIFGTPPGGNRTNVDDDEVVQSNDIDFKPIIDLPELVEVKTGEEGWEVVYCQRSKLFQFVRDSNQWKERAVGDMKILKLDDKYRLLMRQDQVHKVACNHLIAGNMTLSPMATSETAWCWTAQDYAENEAKVEQFALRFKTEELARQFKKRFEEVQELVRARESASQAKKTNNLAIVSKSQDVSVTEEEEEEDDDSEEQSIMFEKRATLTYFENDEWKAGRHNRLSQEHMDAKIRSLAYSQESLVKIVLARNEELVKSNSQLVEALRETREVITQLKFQLNLSQKYNYFSLSTPGPHMASPHHPPYPPPQGMAPPQFGYQMPSPAGLPGYRPPSPRTRSRTNLMGHTGFMGKDESNVVGDDDDENPYFIDGEFFKEVKPTLMGNTMYQTHTLNGHMETGQALGEAQR